MKKRFPILLMLISSSLIIFYSQYSSAKITNQYLINSSNFIKKSSVNDNISVKQLINIKSNKIEINYPKYMLFLGNVNVTYNNNILIADQILLEQLQNTTNKNERIRFITALGNVNYFNENIKLIGIKAWCNLNTKDIDFLQGKYQIIGQQGRGSANLIKERNNNQYIILNDGDFTTCPFGDNSWSIAGSKIFFSKQDQIIKIWNAYFKIGKISIFYSPYLQLPIGNKRRSGFLFFNTKYSSNNGLELNIPYYLNLASNYDFTITPNYISKYGTQIQTEFRYISSSIDKGLIEFDWLLKNSLQHNSYNNNKNYYWMLYWYNKAILNKKLHFNVDYTKISNSNYFKHFESKYNNNNNYALQKFSIGYNSNIWNANLTYKNFQVFHKNSDIYSAVPQFDFNYYSNNNTNLINFTINVQLAKFINSNSNAPEAIRMHLEPTFNFILFKNYYSNLSAQIKLLNTYFQQKNIESYNKNIDNNNDNRKLKKSINRSLMEFKIDKNIIFERIINNSNKWIQTLEPRLQYLYIPYRDQSNIGIYDSTVLQTNYYGLFRDRTYSGLDRISSANQLSSGITTKIYDSQNNIRLNFSIGQIYYFSIPQVTNIIANKTINKYHKNSNNTIWASDAYWRINKQWGVRIDAQYNAYLNNLNSGDAILEYQHNKKSLIQINYRYTNPQYFYESFMSKKKHFKNYRKNSQIGITGSWVLINHYTLTGSYYYNTNTNKTIDQIIGIQYNTYCWSFNISYERKIIGFNRLKNLNKYNNKILFNIEIRGLSKKNKLEVNKILNTNIIPYQKIC